MLFKLGKYKTFYSKKHFFCKLLSTDFHFFLYGNTKKSTFKTSIFVKTANAVYAVHAVLKLTIYTFCMHRHLTWVSSNFEKCQQCDLCILK